MLSIAPLLIAAVTPVSVGDNFYDERTVRIRPGDSVEWSFDGAIEHTVTSSRNQTMRFRSGVRRTGTFSRTFADPGRFTYFCELHGPVMSGVVEVGGPPFPDTKLPVLTRLRARAGDSGVKLGFRLSERSRVKVKLAGPSRRSVTKRLGKGKRSVAFRRLGAGAYKATLRPTDRAGNRGRAVVQRFGIG
jgi:hypothetical protein